MRPLLMAATLLAASLAHADDPDLYASVMQVDPAGTPWKVEVLVKNGGGADAGPFCVHLAPGDADPMPPPLVECLDGMAWGTSQFITFVASPQPPMIWKAYVDIDDDVDESDEDNNALTDVLP